MRDTRGKQNGHDSRTNEFRTSDDTFITYILYMCDVRLGDFCKQPFKCTKIELLALYTRSHPFSFITHIQISYRSKQLTIQGKYVWDCSWVHISNIFFLGWWEGGGTYFHRISFEVQNPFILYKFTLYIWDLNVYVL